MSLPASGAIRVELAGRPWSERVSDGLWVLAAGAAAWVATRWFVPYPGVVAALCAMLALARWSRRPFPDGPLELLPSPGTRQIGGTLVAQVRPLGASGRGRPVWLTPLDLPRDDLRRLALGLRAGGSRSRS